MSRSSWFIQDDDDNCCHAYYTLFHSASANFENLLLFVLHLEQMRGRILRNIV